MVQLKSIARLLAVSAALLLAACAASTGIEETAPASGMPAARVEAEMLRLINHQRARQSLQPLARQPKLSVAALAHARVMGRTGCVDFECAGTSVDRRIAGNGYQYGQSRSYIGAGYGNSGAALAAMMRETRGRELVLSPAFRHVGIGYAFAPGTRYRNYWTISFATPANGNVASLAAEIVRLTNAERRKRGLPALVQNRNLASSAQYHAEFMAHNDCFAHRCPKEPPLDKRALAAGYGFRGVAENIAAGAPTPAEVVNDWMDSPGHRANILHPRMREIGIGYVLLNQDPGDKSYRHYWVQNFGYR